MTYWILLIIFLFLLGVFFIIIIWIGIDSFLLPFGGLSCKFTVLLLIFLLACSISLCRRTVSNPVEWEHIPFSIASKRHAAAGRFRLYGMLFGAGKSDVLERRKRGAVGLETPGPDSGPADGLPQGLPQVTSLLQFLPLWRRILLNPYNIPVR